MGLQRSVIWDPCSAGGGGPRLHCNLSPHLTSCRVDPVSKSVQ